MLRLYLNTVELIYRPCAHQQHHALELFSHAGQIVNNIKERLSCRFEQWQAKTDK